MLSEELTTKESQNRWRELVLKHHPDKKGGSKKITQEINHAKDLGDEELNKIYKELMGDKEDSSTSKEDSEREKTPEEDRIYAQDGSWETREEWEARTGIDRDEFLKQNAKAKKKRSKRAKKARKQQKRNPDKKWR